MLLKLELMAPLSQYRVVVYGEVVNGKYSVEMVCVLNIIL